MRMRKVKRLDQRLAAAAGSLADNPLELRGRWVSGLMPGACGLELELGCGKGAFLCEKAKHRPETLFIGLERIPDAALKGMEQASREEITNIRFAVADAARLPDFFGEGEADTIYLNFSDPWPHWKHAPRRLSHREFLKLYAFALRPGGELRLKTDNVPLFRFSLKELEVCGWRLDFATEDLPPGGGNVETEYESRFRAQGISICSLVAVRPDVIKK